MKHSEPTAKQRRLFMNRYRRSPGPQPRWLTAMNTVWPYSTWNQRADLGQPWNKAAIWQWRSLLTGIYTCITALPFLDSRVIEIEKVSFTFLKRGHMWNRIVAWINAPFELIATHPLTNSSTWLVQRKKKINWGSRTKLWDNPTKKMALSAFVILSKLCAELSLPFL